MEGIGGLGRDVVVLVQKGVPFKVMENRTSSHNVCRTDTPKHSRHLYVSLYRKNLTCHTLPPERVPVQ